MNLFASKPLYKFHYAKLLFLAGFLIFTLSMISQRNLLFSAEGAVPDYFANPFPVTFIAPLFQFSFVAYFPWILLLCFGMLFLKSTKRFAYLLSAVCINFMSLRNQFLSGIDVSTISFTFIYLSIHGEENFRKKDYYLLASSMSFVYFVSGIFKMQDAGWTSGEVMSNLLLTNVSYWTHVPTYEWIKITLSLLTRFVLILELAAPAIMLIPKLRIIGNLLFIFIHLGILVTLKLPHISIFMIGFHFLLLHIATSMQSDEVKA